MMDRVVWYPIGGNSVNLEFVDDLFRFGAISNLFWVAFLARGNHSKLAYSYITIATMISCICFLITSAYDENALFGPFGYLMAFVSRLVVVLTWLFSINALSDNFKIGPLYLLVLGVYCIRSIVFQLDIIPHDVFGIISYVMRATIYVFIIYKVFTERSGDLLEKRRTFRIWFMFLITFGPVIFTLNRIFISDTIYIDDVSLLESIAIFFASSFLLFHSIRPQEKYPFEAGDSSVPGMSANGTMTDGHTELLAADKHNLTILKTKMDAGLYREPGLTVAKLADTIKIQEHRLRKLINRYLGYRNISQYLNDYRVDEAKNRLSDMNERHVPILTIAMETGYRSLRPFNRAFKNRTGHTPSEYRKKHLGAQTGSVTHATAIES